MRIQKPVLAGVLVALAVAVSACSSERGQSPDVVTYLPSTSSAAPKSEQALREAAQRFHGYVASGEALGVFMNLSLRCKARSGGKDAYRASMQTNPERVQAQYGEVVDVEVDGSTGTVMAARPGPHGSEGVPATRWAFEDGAWRYDDC